MEWCKKRLEEIKNCKHTWIVIETINETKHYKIWCDKCNATPSEMTMLMAMTEKKELHPFHTEYVIRQHILKGEI